MTAVLSESETSPLSSSSFGSHQSSLGHNVSSPVYVKTLHSTHQHPPPTYHTATCQSSTTNHPHDIIVSSSNGLQRVLRYNRSEPSAPLLEELDGFIDAPRISNQCTNSIVNRNRCTHEQRNLQTNKSDNAFRTTPEVRRQVDQSQPDDQSSHPSCRLLFYSTNIIEQRDSSDQQDCLLPTNAHIPCCTVIQSRSDLMSKGPIRNYSRCTRTPPPAYDTIDRIHNID